MADNEVSRKYDPAETKRRRELYIREKVLPNVKYLFDRYPKVLSAVLMVSQYWCDEAHDAVHGDILLSEHDPPPLEAYRDRAIASFRNESEESAAFLHFVEGPEADQRPVEYSDPHGAGNISQDDSDETCRTDVSLSYQFGYDSMVMWDDNGEAIPLFAAFCPEGADQEMCIVESSAPCAFFTRNPDGEPHVRMVETMLRPWLDGVQQEFEG